MMTSDQSDPACERCQHTNEILESWMEIFLDYCEHGPTDDLFATRPSDEVPIILKAMFIYFRNLTFDDMLKGEDQRQVIATFRRLMELAAKEIAVLPNERAWKQILAKVTEKYTQMSEEGLDTQSQEEAIVQYLNSEPDLWKQAQLIPDFRDIEDSREEELFNKLRNLTAIG
jgi:hypothetical protein